MIDAMTSGLFERSAESDTDIPLSAFYPTTGALPGHSSGHPGGDRFFEVIFESGTHSISSRIIYP
jgi:hypothetical protein